MSIESGSSHDHKYSRLIPEETDADRLDMLRKQEEYRIYPAWTRSTIDKITFQQKQKTVVVSSAPSELGNGKAVNPTAPPTGRLNVPSCELGDSISVNL